MIAFKLLTFVLLGLITQTLGGAPTVAKLSRTHVYKYRGSMEPRRRQVLENAFIVALEMAQIAIQPKGIPAKRADEIFNKYFQAADRTEVKQVFKNIVGNTYPRQGNPKLADITVDVENSTGICPPESNKPGRAVFYVNTDRLSTMTVCPDFWLYIGNWPEPTCQELGIFVSHIMNVPGASILHEFTHFEFVQSRPGEHIQDYQIKPGPGQTLLNAGPGPALFIKQVAPGLARISAINYQWYATEMWWAAKCQKTLRNPRDDVEAGTGICHGGSCGDL